MTRLPRFALLPLAVWPVAPAGAHAVLDGSVPAAHSRVRVFTFDVAP